MPRQKVDWFGPRLKTLREAAGLSQAELGKRAGVHGSQINKLELGVSQPTLAVALALANGLGVKCDAFTEEAEDIPIKPEKPLPRPGRPRKATAEPVPPAPARAKKPATRKKTP